MSLALAMTAMIWCAPSPTSPCSTELSRPMVTRADRAPDRPPALAALYAGFGATQAIDVYTTVRALRHGAHEANPVLASMPQQMVVIAGVKAASTAAVVFFAERLRKRHRLAALFMMTAIDGATAAVSLHNAAVARRARR